MFVSVDNDDDDIPRSEMPQPTGEEGLSLSDYYNVSGVSQDYSESMLRPHSLADLYDNILELQDEICNHDDSIEDLFNSDHTEHRDTWDLFNALVSTLVSAFIHTNIYFLIQLKRCCNYR